MFFSKNCLNTICYIHYIRKTILSLLFFLWLLPVCAQEMTVKSFSRKTADLSASTQIRKDLNDTPCALVKVLLTARGVQFEPNVIGTVENKLNEYWVYLPAGSKHLKIKHYSALPIDVIFEDYGIRTLESKGTYELVISMPQASSSDGADEIELQYLIFNVTPADAFVTVNGEMWNNAEGVARKFVPLGDYEYRIEAKLYHTQTGLVSVNDPNNKTQLTIELKPAFGYIEIPSNPTIDGATIYIDKEAVGKAPLTSPRLASGQHTVMAIKPHFQSQLMNVTVEDGATQSVLPVMASDFSMVTLQVENNAEIWVNDELKGTGTWTGELPVGECKIETRLEGCRPVAGLKQILAQSQQTITLESPTPRYGSINISMSPAMSDVYIDNQLVGQTPLYLRRYAAGQHEVRISKATYADYLGSVTIEEGRMVEVGGALTQASETAVAAAPAPSSEPAASAPEATTTRIKPIVPNKTLIEDGVELLIDGVSLKMLPVRGGTFEMGATNEQQRTSNDERPVHEVTLSNFYIGETEVTQALWKAVMGNNPSYFQGDNLPVENVSWEDCQEFIHKLNQITGQSFRLPTEAEWEYAARGGRRSRGYRYAGSNKLGEVGWYEQNSKQKTQEARSWIPNELSIYGMSGNVSEWCMDWFGNYTSAALVNPMGGDHGTFRVYRGGGWDSPVWNCRVSYRNYAEPTARYNNLGLRLAL